MRTTNPINSTDRLYLTVMIGRRTLATISVSGVSSLTEVYRHVLNTAQGHKGVMTLYLRNSTQGWVQQHTMVINNNPSAPHKEQPAASSSSYPSLFDQGLFES